MCRKGAHSAEWTSHPLRHISGVFCALMKSSCISHPPQQRLLIIRQWQIEATGNSCAAALLSFFEYWHNFKIDAAQKAKETNEVAEKHGDDTRQEIHLWQFHSSEQLSAGIMGLYGKDAIRTAIARLVELGFLDVGRNLNPKYKFDATKHFLFQPHAVRTWLNNRYATERKDDAFLTEYDAENRTSVAEISQRDAENRQRSAESSKAIPETTSKITSEKDEDKSSSRGASKEELKSLSIRIGAIMKRRPSTEWLPKEKKALKALAPIPEEDIAAVEKYYAAPVQIASDYRRRDVFTLLNNWPGEVDRANRHFSSPANSKPAKTWIA